MRTIGYALASAAMTVAALPAPAATIGAAAPAPAAGDPQAGRALFMRKCSICHSPAEGQTKIGPSLWGVVGRKAGMLPGYTYSEAMTKADRTWNAATLDDYLTNPREKIPGIKMIFAGLPDASDRRNVVAFLATLHPPAP